MGSAFLGFGSEQALRHIAGGLADAVFTTDAGGLITYWNAAAERLTGWAAAEALGNRCSLLAGDVANGCVCGAGPIRCGLALQGRSSKQCTTRTKDGRLLTIVKSAVAIRDATGTAIGALETFTEAARSIDSEVLVEGGFAGLLGRHPVMHELYRTIALVARAAATVMITGESGTGKDAIAAAIHRVGPRADGPLLKASCGSLEPARVGSLLEQARGGTIVLDDVAALAPPAQLALLEALEHREGSRGPTGLDVPRVISTVSRDVTAQVGAGLLRADLFFRLNVFQVRAPPLREHLDDVPLLASGFLARRDRPVSITPAATQVLLSHAWPGNVRELQNALEVAATYAADGRIRPEHLPASVTAPEPQHGGAGAGEERERTLEALARFAGNRTLAARALGISRVTLWKRLKRYGAPAAG
jgi:PAS domain S-box-containing protein